MRGTKSGVMNDLRLKIAHRSSAMWIPFVCHFGHSRGD